MQSASESLRSDPGITLFKPWDSASVGHWSVATSPDMAEIAALKFAWRGRGVTIERLLLDLHSGRIFRATGSRLMDLIGVLLIMLSVSGVVLSKVRNRRK